MERPSTGEQTQLFVREDGSVVLVEKDIAIDRRREPNTRFGSRANLGVILVIKPFALVKRVTISGHHPISEQIHDESTKETTRKYQIPPSFSTNQPVLLALCLCAMHLMYYLDDNGKRVYTLKVRAKLAVEFPQSFVSCCNSWTHASNLPLRSFYHHS